MIGINYKKSTIIVFKLNNKIFIIYSNYNNTNNYYCLNFLIVLSNFTNIYIKLNIFK